MKKQRFSEEKKATIYENAKKAYNSLLKKTEAREEITQVGVSPRAASGYISQFRAMQEGILYTTCCSREMTEYFLKRIKDDFEDEIFQNALIAIELHAKYLANLYLSIVNEYRN